MIYLGRGPAGRALPFAWESRRIRWRGGDTLLALKPYTRTDIGKTERFSMSNPYYNPYCRRGGPVPDTGERGVH